ncbi:MAG: hypothetical protein LHV69_03295 [Elusimicrobia bacterium]|nr:hypothetical protein [Candidatus Obscuribacterium magneticum]
MTAALSVSGCRRNPIERLSDPLPDGAVPNSSGVYVIYDDELKTGGGMMFIPGGENQNINFLDQGAAPQGFANISYSWNGADVMNSTTPQHLYAGFSLIVSSSASQLDFVPGKNLSGPGYLNLKLYVRGSLSTATRLRIEGPSDGTGLTTPARTELLSLGSSWQEVTLPVPAADFANVKVFVTISFQYDQPPRTTNPGNGGIVYVDYLRYEL